MLPKPPLDPIAGRKPIPASNPTARRKSASIVAERERLVAEMALLRHQRGSSKLIDKAQTLLTRWWSKANWNTRAELLKAADWLVRLEMQTPARRPAEAARQRAPPRIPKPW